MHSAGAFQVALVVKNPLASAGDIRDMVLIPGLWGSPGGGHGDPLQYYCQDNPLDRGALQAMVPRVKNSWTRLKQLSTHAFINSAGHGANTPKKKKKNWLISRCWASRSQLILVSELIRPRVHYLIQDYWGTCVCSPSSFGFFFLGQKFWWLLKPRETPNVQSSSGRRRLCVDCIRRALYHREMLGLGHTNHLKVRSGHLQSFRSFLCPICMILLIWPIFILSLDHRLCKTKELV